MEGIVDTNGRMADRWPQTLAILGFFNGSDLPGRSVRPYKSTRKAPPVSVPARRSV
jgi:hypothetical protein